MGLASEDVTPPILDTSSLGTFSGASVTTQRSLAESPEWVPKFPLV